MLNQTSGFGRLTYYAKMFRRRGLQPLSPVFKADTITATPQSPCLLTGPFMLLM